jgi:hypothetical protein
MFSKKNFYPILTSAFISSCISIPGLSPSPSASPSNSPSASPNPSTSASPVTQIGALNDKESFLKFLRCAVNNSNSTNDKATINTLINTINLIPDIAWANAKGAYTNYYSMFEKYCNSNSNTPTPSSSPSNTLKEVELTDYISDGIKKVSCSEEGNVKSESGKSINIEIINNTDKKLKIYWLNSLGKRMLYNNGLASKSTHKQQTYVTHPWLIADENDNCIQIYVPENESAKKIEINNFVFKN